MVNYSKVFIFFFNSCLWFVLFGFNYDFVCLCACFHGQDLILVHSFDGFVVFSIGLFSNCTNLVLMRKLLKFNRMVVNLFVFWGWYIGIWVMWLRVWILAVLCSSNGMHETYSKLSCVALQNQQNWWFTVALEEEYCRIVLYDWIWLTDWRRNNKCFVVMHMLKKRMLSFSWLLKFRADIKSQTVNVYGDKGYRQDEEFLKANFSREALSELLNLVESAVHTGYTYNMLMQFDRFCLRIWPLWMVWSMGMKKWIGYFFPLFRKNSLNVKIQN